MGMIFSNEQWIRGEWKGGQLRIDDRPIVVGTDEHTRLAIALGRRVLDEYSVGVQAMSDSKVMRMLCELFDLTSSGLCMVYDLDARFYELGSSTIQDAFLYIHSLRKR